jgi:hypothetical protein
MNRSAQILAAVLIGICGAVAQRNEPLRLPPVLHPEKEGQEIAERLRTIVPAENAEFVATLEIRRGQAIDRIPIASRLIAGAGNWQMIYEAQATARQPSEKLVVIHAPDRPNVYLYTQGSRETARLSAHETAIPFVGSDFWLSDLGVEFLHWPQQRLLKREMRKGRACQVIESRPATNPSGRGYARVLSWVDAEADGVLMAEAYDARGKLLKEFEVDKLTKVDGRWQLKLMTMRTLRPPSRTTIEFEYDEK